MHRLTTFDNYDSKRELPLTGYAMLVSVFSVAVSAALFQACRARRVRGPGLADTLLLGLAAFQLTRIIAKDRVLAPLRAPFTKYEASAGAGELKETSRGSGLQRAIGDLITCPYCLAPWVAGALSFGLLQQPHATRWLAGVFVIAGISDAAQQGYGALKELSP